MAEWKTSMDAGVAGRNTSHSVYVSPDTGKPIANLNGAASKTRRVPASGERPSDDERERLRHLYRGDVGSPGRRGRTLYTSRSRSGSPTKSPGVASAAASRAGDAALAGKLRGYGPGSGLVHGIDTRQREREQRELERQRNARRRGGGYGRFSDAPSASSFWLYRERPTGSDADHSSDAESLSSRRSMARSSSRHSVRSYSSRRRRRKQEEADREAARQRDDPLAGRGVYNNDGADVGRDGGRSKGTEPRKRGGALQVSRSTKSLGRGRGATRTRPPRLNDAANGTQSAVVLPGRGVAETNGAAANPARGRASGRSVSPSRLPTPSVSPAHSPESSRGSPPLSRGSSSQRSRSWSRSRSPSPSSPRATASRRAARRDGHVRRGRSPRRRVRRARQSGGPSLDEASRLRSRSPSTSASPSPSPRRLSDSRSSEGSPSYRRLARDRADTGSPSRHADPRARGASGGAYVTRSKSTDAAHSGAPYRSRLSRRREAVRQRGADSNADSSRAPTRERARSPTMTKRETIMRPPPAHTRNRMRLRGSLLQGAVARNDKEAKAKAAKVREDYLKHVRLERMRIKAAFVLDELEEQQRQRDEIEHARRTEASIKIQAAGRGLLGRRLGASMAAAEYERLRAEIAAEQKGAAFVQAAWRGFLERLWVEMEYGFKHSGQSFKGLQRAPRMRIGSGGDSPYSGLSYGYSQAPSYAAPTSSTYVPAGAGIMPFVESGAPANVAAPSDGGLVSVPSDGSASVSAAVATKLRPSISADDAAASAAASIAASAPPGSPQLNAVSPGGSSLLSGSDSFTAGGVTTGSGRGSDGASAGSRSRSNSAASGFGSGSGSASTTTAPAAGVTSPTLSAAGAPQVDDTPGQPTNRTVDPAATPLPPTTGVQPAPASAPSENAQAPAGHSTELAPATAPVADTAAAQGSPAATPAPASPAPASPALSAISGASSTLARKMSSGGDKMKALARNLSSGSGGLRSRITKKMPVLMLAARSMKGKRSGSAGSVGSPATGGAASPVPDSPSVASPAPAGVAPAAEDGKAIESDRSGDVDQGAPPSVAAATVGSATPVAVSSAASGARANTRAMASGAAASPDPPHTPPRSTQQQQAASHSALTTPPHRPVAADPGSAVVAIEQGSSASESKVGAPATPRSEAAATKIQAVGRGYNTRSKRRGGGAAAGGAASGAAGLTRSTSAGSAGSESQSGGSQSPTASASGSRGRSQSQSQQSSAASARSGSGSASLLKQAVTGAAAKVMSPIRKTESKADSKDGNDGVSDEDVDNDAATPRSLTLTSHASPHPPKPKPVSPPASSRARSASSATSGAGSTGDAGAAGLDSDGAGGPPSPPLEPPPHTLVERVTDDDAPAWPSTVSLLPRGGFKPLAADRKGTAERVRRDRHMRVHTVTWDLSGHKPPGKEAIATMLPAGQYHIYAVCLQNIVEDQAADVKEAIGNHLDADMYYLLEALQEGGVMLCVYVHRGLVPMVTGTVSGSVALGSRARGGVGIAFSVALTSCVFVGCALTSGAGKVSKRADEFDKIDQELTLMPTSAGNVPPLPEQLALDAWKQRQAERERLRREKEEERRRQSVGSGAGGASGAATAEGGADAVTDVPDSPRPPVPTAEAQEANVNAHLNSVRRQRHVSARFERVWWLGALNFCISGASHQVELKFRGNNHAALFQRDELRSEMEDGQVSAFTRLAEGPLLFLPTARYLVNSNKFDTRMAPAWADRVLFSPEGIDLLQYDALYELRNSDRRPVAADFRCHIALPRAPEVESDAKPELGTGAGQLSLAMAGRLKMSARKAKQMSSRKVAAKARGEKDSQACVVM